jgi:cytochrome P450
MEDPEALCDQLLNVFLAGRDTAAVALSNVFFCVARHPLVWRKTRDETEGLKAGELSFEKLKGLRYTQYTQYAINEGISQLTV